MFSTFAEFAVVLAIATVVLLIILTHVTRGRALQVTKMSGTYWEIKNQNHNASVVVSKFVNRSTYQIEWSYSAKLFFDVAPEHSAETEITLNPGERATIYLNSAGPLSLRAVPLKSIARKFDLVARNI